jgi:hypothetical protein
MVARVVADELGERDWLRFVATANLPNDRTDRRWYG